jgi:hypothetical protein
MKDLNLLVWLTQLGFSVAFPLAGFVLLAVWLRNRFGWGDWVVWVGLILGLVCAFTGFRDSLRVLSGMSKKKDNPEPPPVSFNQHD